jgi:hypothetical protein
MFLHDRCFLLEEWHFDVKTMHKKCWTLRHSCPIVWHVLMHLDKHSVRHGLANLIKRTVFWCCRKKKKKQKKAKKRRRDSSSSEGSNSDKDDYDAGRPIIQRSRAERDGPHVIAGRGKVEDPNQMDTRLRWLSEITLNASISILVYYFLYVCCLV